MSERSSARPSISHFPGLSATKAMRSDLIANEQGVHPIGLPTVVEAVEQADVMSVQVYDLQMATRVVQAQGHGAAAPDGEQRCSRKVKRLHTPEFEFGLKRILEVDACPERIGRKRERRRSTRGARRAAVLVDEPRDRLASVLVNGSRSTSTG